MLTVVSFTNGGTPRLQCIYPTEPWFIPSFPWGHARISKRRRSVVKVACSGSWTLWDYSITLLTLEGKKVGDGDCETVKEKV